MKSYFLFALLSLFTFNDFTCQNESSENKTTTTLESKPETMNELPYHQIPDAPSTYTAATVAARTIDGLGYRFYWASEGLTEKDRNYDPGNENRSPEQMMDHFVGLSKTILNGVKNIPNVRPAPKQEMTFEEKRAAVLNNLKVASDLLRVNPEMDLNNCNIIFQRGEKKSEFPFWNLLNGPIADAIYHAGQLVSYRRSAGNPMNPNVSVFTGKNRE